MLLLKAAKRLLIGGGGGGERMSKVSLCVLGQVLMKGETRMTIESMNRTIRWMIHVAIDAEPELGNTRLQLPLSVV